MWLNITNIALGVVTAACIGAVAWGAAVEVAGRIARKARVGLEHDDHAFVIHGLGVTMADGGEKHDDAETK
jgi:hypothetical protein